MTIPALGNYWSCFTEYHPVYSGPCSETTCSGISTLAVVCQLLFVCVPVQSRRMTKQNAILVGGLNPSEKIWNILVSWDDYSQSMENSKNVLNHQPEYHTIHPIYILSWWRNVTMQSCFSNQPSFGMKQTMAQRKLALAIHSCLNLDTLWLWLT